MTPFAHDYLIPGEIFADETILCMRCAEPIMRLSYKEMKKLNEPNKTVNVAYKMKLGNYRQLPVVLHSRGKDTITSLVLCQPCIKETVPEAHSDEIIEQIIRATQAEARWVGLPEDAIKGIEKGFINSRIVRKLNPQEVIENRILEEIPT